MCVDKNLLISSDDFHKMATIKFQSFFYIYNFSKICKKKEKLFMAYIIKKVTDLRIITIITN